MNSYGPNSPSYSGGEDTVASSDTERETFNDRGRNATSAELRRLRSEVERLTLEAERKDREATRLTGELSRLETELTRGPNTTPAQATIGGASLSDLLRLSTAELSVLDDDIRMMRRRVLDRPATGYAESVQEYLAQAMREAMSRRGVRYEDGTGCDCKAAWLKVYQKKELEDDARLLGLRDSRRGVPARVEGGRYDIIVACDTLIGLSRWRNIH